MSNFVHKEGGDPSGLRIGSIESVSRYFARETLCTTLIMGGYLLLFMMLHTYRTNLFFALFCLVWFMRTGVTGTKPIMSVFPDLSWYLTFRMEYMAILLACLLLSLALDAMFIGLLQRPVRIAIIAANGVAVLLFCVAPTVFMTHALIYAYGMVLVCALYVVIRFLWQLKRLRTTEQLILLVALVIFIYTAIREMFYHSNILIFPVMHSGMMDFAALVFVLFQMTAAFLGTMREVAEAREKEQRLALDNAALDRVNRLKTDMINTVSHELYTPLAAMMGYAEIVSKEMRLQGGQPRDHRRFGHHCIGGEADGSHRGGNPGGVRRPQFLPVR